MLCEKQPAPGVGDAVAGCGRRWTGRSASGDASRSAEGTFGDRLGDSVGAGFCRDGSCEGGLLFSLPLLTLFSGLVYFVNAKWARISEPKTSENTFRPFWLFFKVHVEDRPATSV